MATSTRPINNGFSTDELGHWTQIARSEPKHYRNNLLYRWFRLHENYFFDEFFYFTYREEIWTHNWKGPPYISTHDLFSSLQIVGREETCNTVIAATTLRQRGMPEIEQHLVYMREKMESMNSWILSASPPWNPHLAVCKFLTESDTPSVREFAREFENSWFGHWDEVRCRSDC